MSEEDIVVAYQAREGVLGLARLASRGKKSHIDGYYDTFDLSPKPTVWLDNPIPYAVIKSLPKAEDLYEFVRIHQGTVFAIKDDGFNRIIHLILAFNPNLEKKIQQLIDISFESK
jgi:hypothetical protein